ncbi:hypothetical protein T492DRAFT_869526 [Pavlovales sp. CCMP2436]|nr:hypothetical protein T492DRAFT_869526 [Pavlovales sp. CCMP2436]
MLTEALADLLRTSRHFVLAEPPKSGGKTEPAKYSKGGKYGGGLERIFDPRLLLFEFVHNVLLRKAQFVAKVRAGDPMVKQMLMGGGKTTVISPILSLMLGDGKALVIQMMPPALLEQTVFRGQTS